MGVIKDLKDDIAASKTREGREARKAELTAQLEAKKAELGLGERKPVRMPKFSKAVVDGKCPRCGGTTFKAKRSGFGKGLGAVFGGIGILAAPKSQTRCETCGLTFRRG